MHIQKLILTNMYSNIEMETNIISLSTTMTNAPSSKKKKAMSSEKASKVKKEGHSNETDFSLMIPGSEVLEGTGKVDVQYKNYSFSLKKECKRIQMALYSLESKNWLETSPSAMLCKDCLTIYPKNFEEYVNEKQHYKELLREKMVNLKNHLCLKENLREYLNLIIFKNGEVHFLVMKDKGLQYIYESSEVLDVLLNNVEVFNSSALKKGDIPEQKVVIKSKQTNTSGGIKWVNLIEIEVRNSSKGHYAQMLCVCNRDILFSLLNKNIEKTNQYEKIVLFGKSNILYEEIQNANIV